MKSETYPGMNFPKQLPAQKQNSQPGIESMMNPTPVFQHESYNKQSNRLEGKVAIVTGGDSGIGRAVSIAFAKEAKGFVENEGKRCLLISGDIGDEQFCIQSVKQVKNEFSKIDILINNSAEQHEQTKIEDITKDQLDRTFKTNLFSAFYLTKAVLPHFKEGSCIINTTSITAYKGSQNLIDYSCTKGALATFTRSLSTNLAKRNIRVNAVAPGPIWTPLIPSSFTEQDVAQFGTDTPMGRAGQPVELAQAYVFLASDDASYMTGQTIHINGGVIING